MSQHKSRILRRHVSLLIGLFLSIAVAQVCLFQGTSYAAEQMRLHAVVVGVTRFQDNRIPALQLSAKDATDFYTFLKEREQYFKSANLTLLTDEKATRANITSAVRNKLKSAGRDDIVIIYLSGHGAVDSQMGNEFYFLTNDAKFDNLFGTALLMNDSNLFKGISSDRCVLIADACHSGGFTAGLELPRAKSLMPLFQSLKGRLGIASSRPDELSYEKPVYGNSVFTHFLLKGLRGEAVKDQDKGLISAKSLYDYVAKATSQATSGQQNPQIYNESGANAEEPIFVSPKYSNALKIDSQFQYETEDGNVRVLEDNATLKSGQHIGVTFKPESDCYVYIFWWDSTGNVGCLFPNPELTAGDCSVKAGRTYWLPYSAEGDRWYVLDNNPGTETIYFVASRERNKKLESLYSKMRGGTDQKGTGAKEKALSAEIEREINLMGFVNKTVAKVSGASSVDRRSLFESIDNEIKVSGADASYRVSFRHVQ
jgi:uncharacterized caspase-like protein